MSNQISEFIANYLKYCPGLRPVKYATVERRRRIRHYLRWRPMDWWVEYFKKVQATDFLCGRARVQRAMSGQWEANFDWILESRNIRKILSDRYNEDWRNKQQTGDADADL